VDGTTAVGADTPGTGQLVSASTWNRNRATAGSRSTWCTGVQHGTRPALPGPHYRARTTGTVERAREHHGDTKAVSRSQIDRLCGRRDVPLREKALRRMLSASVSCASAVFVLNVEGLDLANKRARITAKGRRQWSLDRWTQRVLDRPAPKSGRSSAQRASQEEFTRTPR
jgi:hypothetical protein